MLNHAQSKASYYCYLHHHFPALLSQLVYCFTGLLLACPWQVSTTLYWWVLKFTAWYGMSYDIWVFEWYGTHQRVFFMCVKLLHSWSLPAAAHSAHSTLTVTLGPQAFHTSSWNSLSHRQHFTAQNCQLTATCAGRWWNNFCSADWLERSAFVATPTFVTVLLRSVRNACCCY